MRRLCITLVLLFCSVAIANTEELTYSQIISLDTVEQSCGIAGFLTEQNFNSVLKNMLFNKKLTDIAKKLPGVNIKNTSQKSDANNYYNLAIDAIKQGNYEQAINYLTMAIQIDPDFADAYYVRAIVYKDLGDYDQAIADYNKVIDLAPNAVPVYNDRGVTYKKLGKYNQAIADYNKAIELDPDFVLAYINRGVAYIDLEKYDQAITDLNKAIKLDPNNAEAYNNRGVAYDKQQKYDQAIDDFTKAIELDPSDALVYYNRGVAYYKLGKYNQAAVDLAKVLQLNPQGELQNAASDLLNRIDESVSGNKQSYKECVDDCMKGFSIMGDKKTAKKVCEQNCKNMRSMGYVQ